MPELPEVETVAQELRDNVLGRRIKSVTAIWNRSFDNQCETALAGQSIERIDRKGKYLILNLERTFLIIHLRMTGQLLFYPGKVDAAEDHVRIIMQFVDQTELHFKDMRKFGRFYHVSDIQGILNNVGIDALDRQLGLPMFRKVLRNSKMNIKAFLLSQKYISGLGNIYVDESLFLSRLHPSTMVSDLTPSESKRLFENIVFVLKQAVRNMGSTISDYRDMYGNRGNNQKFFRVYGRAGDPCPVCGTQIKKIKFAGRGTHFCPSCQIKQET
jgi:formamidopyrimidine-DNA glycosylase